MAVLTTCILVGLGATALIGTGAYLWNKDDVEAERLNKRLTEISNETNANNTVIERYNTIKGKIQNAIDYLDNGKSDFVSGGHVLDNIPLANTEFSNTQKKLNQANMKFKFWIELGQVIVFLVL
jgi:hypothetical protein